jgi:hypothetical protein
MNIDIFLSTIGINTFDNNYKYIIYVNLLLFVISYTPLYYGIYNIFVLKSTDQILQCMMMLNDIILYFFIMRKKQIHFTKKFYNEDINPRQKNKIIYPLLIITIVTSIILSIIFFILSINNINITLINQLTNNSILKSINTFSYIYYSSQIRIYNCIIFFSVFFTISNYIKDYNILLSNNDYSIPDICQQFIEIRHKYGKGVKYLNNILSTTITFNFIPCCMLFINIFSNKPTDLLSIRSSIYFILSIIGFHIILVRINNSIDSIRNTIDNNRYLRLFLERKPDDYSLNIELEELDQINSNQINLKNYLLEIENGNSIDWMIINNITSQPWKSFEILGYEWKNNDIISKLLSLIILLWIGKSII